MVRMTKQHAAALTLIASAAAGPDALGYQFIDSRRWFTTATDGSGLVQGDPTTLTWSLIRDGQGGTPPSELIAFFDGLYPGGSGADLTQRPWFPIFDNSFGRIAELSGVTFIYEPNDDGNPITGGASSDRRGILGVRGDIRFEAYPIDGQVSPNVAARSQFPNNSDVTIDSDNTDFFGDATNDSRGARNVITHELFHGLGVEHVESDDADLLLEPMVLLTFDGPQLGDIIALHRGYGDHYEKSNNGAGNETPALATPMGALTQQTPLSLGTHADDAVVERGETDFVSIDNFTDTDVYSFTIDIATPIDITLTPMGPTYQSGAQNGTQSPLDTSSLSDLTLTLLDRDGVTPLVTVDANPAGGDESIDNLLLDQTGTYYVRITGSDNAPQLYQLDVAAVPEPRALAGALIGLVLAGRRRR